MMGKWKFDLKMSKHGMSIELMDENNQNTNKIIEFKIQ